MKIKILVIAIVIAFGVGMSFYYFAEFKMNEITPDNYTQNLQLVYSKSVFRGNNTVFLDNPSILINANNEMTNNVYKFNKYSAIDDVVEINDTRIKDFWYAVFYDKKTKMPHQYSINV